PEEVVSQGAALQAEVIKGKVKDILLLDVTSLSLGVETKGDTFTKIIESNSTIPIKKSMRFTTITDNQQTVTIHVLQGERDIASHNKSLGYFNLVGITPAPKGTPQIDVTFEIDANGIVRVSAKDIKTGLVQSMKIQPASGLSPEEIQERVREAKEYQQKDKLEIKLNKNKIQVKEGLEAIKIFYNQHASMLNPVEKTDMKNLITRAEAALDELILETLEDILVRIATVRAKINKMIASEFGE
ncbi:MAG: Hsp70 family protein, partial [bacterium]|nr:Hsp70 family protein [bacterium]